MTEIEVLRLELAAARRHVELLVKTLVGIHQLLYPPRVTIDTRNFGYDNPSCNVMMHELSDRIRRIPEEIQAAERGGQ